MSPDRKPATHLSFAEREAALPVSDAAELLLGMFDLQTGRKYNPQVGKLLRTNWLYKQFDYYAWLDQKPTTAQYSPDSPLIRPANVGYAEQIVSVTYDHYFLGWGPQQNIIIAQGKNDVKAYWIPKRQKEASGAFYSLPNWDPVRELLQENPRRQEEGVQISLWERDLELPYYGLAREGRYIAMGCRLIELLEFLRKK